MIVLNLSKKIQVFIGVYRESQANSWSFLYKLLMNIIFITGMFGPLMLGSLAFIVVNFMDLKTSTNAMVIMMAGCSGFV